MMLGNLRSKPFRSLLSLSLSALLKHNGSDIKCQVTTSQLHLKKQWTTVFSYILQTMNEATSKSLDDLEEHLLRV